MLAEKDLVAADDIRKDRNRKDRNRKDRNRKDRNNVEYGIAPVTAAHIRAAADVAERIVNAIANTLASGSSRSTSEPDTR